MDTNPSPIPAELLLAHADWVRRLAFTLVRDTALAEDLAQETWLATLLHPPSQDRPLRPWLAEVLRNFVRMWAREKGRRARREEVAASTSEAEAPSPEALVARLELQQVLAGLVHELPEPIRQTVLLRYTEGFSAADIARRMKVPAGTVRWRLKEGLDQIRGRLDQRAGGDRQSWCTSLIAVFGLPRPPAPASPAGLGAWKAVVVAAAVLAPLGLLSWRLRTASPPETAGAARAGGPAGSALPALRGQLGGSAVAGGAIEGVVLDPDGRPAAGALVTAVRETVAPDGSVPRAAATDRADARGSFTLVGLPPGSHGVSATAPGFAPASASAVEVSAGSRRSLTLRLTAGGFALTGVVEDRGGGVIPNASVRARPRHGPRGPAPVFHALTDQEGRYTLPLPHGAFEVIADAGGYARVQDRVEVRGGLARFRRDFRLNPAGRLRGLVIDAATGQPVAQAEVAASPHRFGFSAEASTTTGADGTFELGDLEPGEYTLQAQQGARAGASGHALVLPTAGFIDGVRLTIQRGAAMSGTVRDQAGRLLAGAVIRVDDGRSWARSDEGGRFRLDGLLPGVVSVQPLLPGYGGRPVEVEVALAPAATVELTMQPAVAIEGRVVAPSGAPVAGAEIAASARALTAPNHFASERRLARSAADGSFTIDEIAGTDALTVEATHRDHGLGRVSVPLAGGPQRVTITLAPGGSISGTVRFADGSPAPGAAILGLRGGGSTFSADDGSYWLGPFAGATTFQLTASQRELWLVRDRPGDLGRRTVELRAGERRTGVDLVISRSNRRISGVVLGPDGRPLDGAVVSAKLVAGPGDTQVSIGSGADEDHVVSAADGSFAIGDLDAESYRVRARFPGLPDVKLPAVAAGTDDLRLRFAPAVSLSGVVIGPGGQPATHYRLLVTPHRGEDRPGERPGDQLELWDQVAFRRLEVHAADGTFALGGLPAGTYDLRAESEGAMAALPPLSVAAGEERRGLELRLGGGITVTGRVVDALSGAPRAGVEVAAFSFDMRRSTTTEGDGTFRIERLPRGALIQLTLQAGRDRFPSERKVIRAPAAGEVVAVSTVKLLAQAGGDAGVGVELGAYPGGALVERVTGGSSAARNRIRPGDLFVSVAGRDVSDWGPIAIEGLLAGATGTTVVAVVRSGSGAQRTVTLRRDAGYHP